MILYLHTKVVRAQNPSRPRQVTFAKATVSLDRTCSRTEKYEQIKNQKEIFNLERRISGLNNWE
jgi:hypothetical protein